MKLAQLIIACISLDAVWSKHDKSEQTKRGIFDSDFGLGYGAYGGHYGVYGGGNKGGYNDKINALIQLAKNVDATKIAQQKISPTPTNQFPYPIPYNYPILSNTFPINLPQLYAVHKPFMYRPFHYTVPQLSPYTTPLSKLYPFDISPYLNPVRQPLFSSLTPFADIPPNRGGFYSSFTIPQTAPFNTNPFNLFFDNPGTVYPDNAPALPTHISPTFGNLPVPQPSPIIPQNVGTSGSAVSAAVGSSSSSSVGASTQSVSTAVTSSSSQTASGGSTSGRAVASSAAQSTTVAGSSQSVASSSSSSQSKAST